MASWFYLVEQALSNMYGATPKAPQSLMKTYWPLLLALAIVVALVVCYVQGWTTLAWVMVGALIAFPLVYVGVVVLAHEAGKPPPPPR